MQHLLDSDQAYNYYKTELRKIAIERKRLQNRERLVLEWFKEAGVTVTFLTDGYQLSLIDEARIDVSREVLEVYHTSGKIQAIKTYRELVCCGLKEAKEETEKIINTLNEEN